MDRVRTPYGLEIIQSCLSCTVREGALFCNLGRAALAQLDRMRQTSLYPAGAVLFIEGEPARGLYVLCSGRVKLTASSPQGRSVIIRVAGPGEVLGLSGTISDSTYVASAETLEPAQVNFIPREGFVRFLETQPEVAIRVARHLSMELRRAYQQVTLMVLSPNVRARLAGLLLDELDRDGKTVAKGTRLQLRFTHQEMAEIIGSSRETVTRLMSDFRDEALIETKGSFITILNPEKLQSILG